MTNINERRLLQRTNLAIYLKVVNCENDNTIGNIIDINVLGFLILAEKEPPKEKQLNIKIAIPDGICDKSFAACTAIVRRVSRSVNPSFFEAGFEITDISPEDRETIEQLEQALLLKFGN